MVGTYLHIKRLNKFHILCSMKQIYDLCSFVLDQYEKKSKAYILQYPNSSYYEPISNDRNWKLKIPCGAGYLARILIITPNIY